MTAASGGRLSPDGRLRVEHLERLPGLFRKMSLHLLPEVLRGAVFLLSLVLCASMMPVSSLPAASPATTLGLGFLSSVCDNIPLTALALRQGRYDWGFLACAVGYGGSMPSGATGARGAGPGAAPARGRR